MRPLAFVFAVLALAACAPIVQRPQIAPPGFPGPRLEGDRFISFDAAPLGFSHWDVEHGEPWAVVVGLHGMDDYGNAFHLAGPYWAERGIATYAYDQRGFGRSPDRGVWGGDELMMQDLRTFTALVRARFPHAIVAVVGESLGGAVAIETFASDRPPDADRLVLAAPAVWGWSSQPVTYSLALEIAAHTVPTKVLTPPKFVTDHVQASDNIPELEAMGQDPLMIWGARTDALYGLVTTMEHGWRDIGAVRTPTLYLLGARDQIIPEKPSLHAARRLPAGARTAYYAQGWHLLLRDKQAHNVYDDIAAFLRDPAAPMPSGAPPIPRTPHATGAAAEAGALVGRAARE